MHLLPLLKKDATILIVGCGTSSLSEKLYDAGYHNITNIDFSSIVIEKMNSIHSELRPLMKWLTMDMLDMKFDDNSFDIVIDKATMDALMVDEGDVWDPNQHTISDVDRMCAGISRIINPLNHGLFIQLSFSQPHFRTKYLMACHIRNNRTSDSSSTSSPYTPILGICDQYSWDLSYTIIETEAGCLNSFLYVMKSFK